MTLGARPVTIGFEGLLGLVSGRFRIVAAAGVGLRLRLLTNSFVCHSTVAVAVWWLRLFDVTLWHARYSSKERSTAVVGMS